MDFKDTKTNEIVELDEIKENYIQSRKEGDLKYINFQHYLMDCINKYKTIEVI